MNLSTSTAPRDVVPSSTTTPRLGAAPAATTAPRLSVGPAAAAARRFGVGPSANTSAGLSLGPTTTTTVPRLSGGPAASTGRRLGVGLYDSKPAFQARLAGLADLFFGLGVHPDVLTFAGLGCALVGGAALAAGVLLNEPAWLWLVPLFAVVRLVFNALDGMVAVRAGVARAWGKVLNELCDRLADLAFLAPLLLVPGLSAPLVTAALCMTLLVSYLGVLAEAAGTSRQYGGVMGKADRMVWLALATAATAATGSLLALQALPYVLLIGGGVTLLGRGRRAHALL